MVARFIICQNQYNMHAHLDVGRQNQINYKRTVYFFIQLLRPYIFWSDN